MSKIILSLVTLLLICRFNEPEINNIASNKISIMSELSTPKGIALVWPEELPIAPNSTCRSELKDFYIQLLGKIPIEIEVTIIVKYKNLRNRIQTQLQKIYPDRNFIFIVISSVRDIWIRDWAPIIAMKQGETFAIKANYQPFIYLTKRESEPDNKAGLYLAKEYNISSTNLTWDGGNFTHNGNGIGIVTERIIEDNKNYSIEEIRTIIKELLGIDKLIFVPVEPEDETGHVDGMVRFISSNIVAVSRYPKKYTKENDFLNKIVELLKKELGKNFEIIRISNGEIDEEETEGIASAVGNHLNFLLLGDKILMPQYNPNDTIAINELKEYFKSDNIINIDCNKLAKKGGVLNCITWEYY